MNYKSKPIILGLSMLLAFPIYSNETPEAIKQLQEKQLCRENKKRIANMLDSHVSKHGRKVNTIRVSAAIDRDAALVDEEAWEAFVSYVTEMCLLAQNEEWITNGDIEINSASKSAAVKFIFGGEEIGIQGEISVLLGAAECCKDCYPVCLCQHNRDGNCHCSSNGNSCLPQN